jgi:DNA-binding ferritin-like protein (Dps family)
MNNVIQLKPCANPSAALRNIAEMLESGELEAEEVTVIAGTDVFQCGCFNDERAAESAIFSMTMGIHKLMKPVMDSL